MMQSKQRKTLAVLVVALSTAGTALAAVPGQAAAEWPAWAGQDAQKALVVAGEPGGDSSQGALLTEEAAPVESGNEAVVIDKAGQTTRVAIADSSAPARSVPVDKRKAASLQDLADRGQQPWLLDPVLVVKNDAEKYGFSRQNDTFTLISRVHRGPGSGTGEAMVLVQQKEKFFLVRLIQPAGPGAGSIWQINSIQQVKVVARSGKPDVGPGVEGLDYSKVIKWQQNVDAGRELWRLDPLQVARNEGKNYGFTAQDTYTVVRKLSSSPIARHGEVDVQVIHQGKPYLMVLVKPFGGDGAIWTTYRVERATGGRPAPEPAGRVLFSTDKLAGWDWYKGNYPRDMAFAVIDNYKARSQGNFTIPGSILEQVKDIDYNNKVVLLAYLGTAGGADNIGIEKVTLQGNTVTVQVRTRSAKPGEMETKMLTHPSAYVAVDRTAVDIWGGTNFVFVDQQGRVLEKTRMVIDHHR